MNSFTVEHNTFRQKLIEMVKRNPIIWDKKDENYNRNRPQKFMIWDEIRKELNVDIDTARSTWENLRHQYRRDLRRELTTKDFKSKWRFYKEMEFIRETVKVPIGNRNTKSDAEQEIINVQPSNSQSTISLEPKYAVENPRSPEEFQDSYDSFQEDLTSPVESTHTFEVIPKQEPDFEITILDDTISEESAEALQSKVSNQQNPRELQKNRVLTSSPKRTTASLGNLTDTTTKASTSKADHKNQTDLDLKDEDFYFVMGILPSLRQVPKNRKFHLRLGIMNLIAKDLESVQ